jgi:integrase
MMLTGARPGEICRLTPAELHRSGEVDLPGVGIVNLDAVDVWVYAPKRHKTARLGKWKWIVFGKQAKAIITPFLCREPNSFFFSPLESIEGLRKEQIASRLAKGGGSGGNRKQPLKKPARKFRSYYTPVTLNQAVKNAIKKANKICTEDNKPLIKHWYPYQLRHMFASNLADLDQARAALGHSDPQMTLRYAKRSFALAAQVARDRG